MGLKTFKIYIYNKLRNIYYDIDNGDHQGYSYLVPLKTIMSSNCYRNDDWEGVLKLSHRLIAINKDMIALAKDYPDIFHPNVGLGREQENAILDEIVRRLSRA